VIGASSRARKRSTKSSMPMSGFVMPLSSLSIDHFA
jgi:hypothetical protein